MVVLPPIDVTLAMVYVALGLVAFLLAAGMIVSILLLLLRLVFVPRTPKAEIVPNGLIIFDI